MTNISTNTIESRLLLSIDDDNLKVSAAGTMKVLPESILSQTEVYLKLGAGEGIGGGRCSVHKTEIYKLNCRGKCIILSPVFIWSRALNKVVCFQQENVLRDYSSPKDEVLSR